MDYTERAYRHRRTVASSSRHRPRHDLHRQGRTIASSSWCPSRRPKFDISAGPGASPSLHRPTSDTSASLADQLRHVSRAEGFASASQPLPALPCRRFIAHQEMGVRIESQFRESPSFRLLQQINQVLLIPAFFACLGSFFPRNYYFGLSILCTQVYQMVATLATVAWWFGQFPYIVRRTPHLELGPTCEFRLCHAFTASRRRPAST